MSQIQIFELVDALEPGKQAKALMLKWNGTSYTSRGAKPILVYSFTGAHGVAGDRGYCLLGGSARWEVVGGVVSERSLGS
ncbi:MAG TPA: hypothetical protein VGZ26_05675 [Pirellulales bacterium]|jgi:hypothetical protein|nr:hypothetical protein [Pirellulales bacterium]